MKKLSVKFFFLLLISVQVLAQTTVVRSQNVALQAPAQASAKVFLPKSSEKIETKKIAPEGVNINILPFFGDFEKNEIQKNQDEEFLKSCDLNFASRTEASQFFAARAWEYLTESQVDTATHRFNLTWLLNDKNVDSYWGLGVIAFQQGDLHNAMKFLEHGHAIDDKNITLTVDLATVRIQCFLKDKEPKDMEEANSLLENALTIEPNFANAYMKLSLAQLVQGDFNKAWVYFHKGYDIDKNSLDIDLLTALMEKFDDPKGMFRK